MSDQALGRRELLLGAGVAAGSVVAGVGLAAPAAAKDRGEQHNHGLTGSWLFTRQDDGDPAKVRGVFSFADGDVIVEHDILPAGPPFTGTWESPGDDSFRATFWSGFPGDGPDAPGVAVRVRVEGRVHDDELSGSYRVAVFDDTGKEIQDGGPTTGTFFDGQRIDA